MRTRQRLVLDALIAAGLIAAYRPTWTGIALHEWISAAIVVPLIVHLVVNWEWCLRIARTFFDRLFHATRANFVVDLGLLVSSIAVVLSGVMVSPVPGWFGMQPAQLMLWARLHAISADAIIALFVVHAALHRRWIASATKRLFAGDAAAAGATPARARAAAPVRTPAGRPALTPAQSRRAARLAAERAAVKRRASVGGVLGVGVAIASLIFASVAVAGPALAKSGASGTAAAAAASAAATAKPASAPTSAAAPASAAPAAKAAPKTAAASPKPAATPAKKVAAAKLTCPRTGCAAYTCHGTSGASPNTWYQTHN